MHQPTTPPLSQTIWPRWASRQFLTLPIVQTLLPVTFAYSLSSEVIVIRQLRRWKRLRRRSLTRSHKRTSVRPSEVVGTVQVHCSRRTLLRRGLEFHVCTINKSTHMKNSGNIVNDPRIYIYIYIYVIIYSCPYLYLSLCIYIYIYIWLHVGVCLCAFCWNDSFF